jgi:hypothetical protein
VLPTCAIQSVQPITKLSKFDEVNKQAWVLHQVQRPNNEVKEVSRHCFRWKSKTICGRRKHSSEVFCSNCDLPLHRFPHFCARRCSKNLLCDLHQRLQVLQKAWNTLINLFQKYWGFHNLNSNALSVPCALDDSLPSS